MSREFTQADVDEAAQFAELEDRAIDFLTNKLNWDSQLGRGVFGFDDSPSRKEAADNFTRGDGSAPEDGTLLKLHCNLWATIDWSRPDVGQQIETGLRRMAEFLQQTATRSPRRGARIRHGEECRRPRNSRMSGRTALPTGVNHDGRFSVPLYGQANPQDPEVWELVL